MPIFVHLTDDCEFVDDCQDCSNYPCELFTEDQKQRALNARDADENEEDYKKKD